MLINACSDIARADSAEFLVQIGTLYPTNKVGIVQNIVIQLLFCVSGWVYHCRLNSSSRVYSRSSREGFYVGQL